MLVLDTKESQQDLMNDSLNQSNYEDFSHNSISMKKPQMKKVKQPSHDFDHEPAEINQRDIQMVTTMQDDSEYAEYTIKPNEKLLY